jgi:hypothetical protein
MMPEGHMTTDDDDRDERATRLQRMIDQQVAAKEKRLRRRAVRLWKRAERERMLIRMEQPPTSVH